jgi:hypothetical protein
VKLEYIPLTGTFLRLQPFAPELKAEVRSAVDCDPDAWAIMPINPMGDGFDAYLVRGLRRSAPRADGIRDPTKQR